MIVIIRDLPLTCFLLWNHVKHRPMSLKFCLFSFLSRNTLSRKHDVGILFTWAVMDLWFWQILTIFVTDSMDIIFAVYFRNSEVSAATTNMAGCLLCIKPSHQYVSMLKWPVTLWLRNRISACNCFKLQSCSSCQPIHSVVPNTMSLS